MTTSTPLLKPIPLSQQADRRMRLTRCYVSSTLSVGQEIPLPSDVSHHLVRVLRLKTGDACIVFNGDGQDYTAKISQTNQNGLAWITVTDAQARRSESPLEITLVQGLARGEKMDWIVQKAVELGVKRLLPVMTGRSLIQLDKKRLEKRQRHWHAVMIAACEQSSRASLPQLKVCQSLSDLAAKLPTDSILVQLDPNAEQPLTELERPTSIVLAIGPEGGWSVEDHSQLSTMGFKAYRLGPRILRTETAGLAAVATMQAILGDFSA